MSCLPFTNMTVQVLTSKGPNPVPGWTFIPTDTNTGVGGKYIYLGYTTDPGKGKSITDLTFQAYNDAQQGNPMPDWEWNSNDLKQGAGGKYIYMFWKSDTGNPNTILNLMLVVTDQSSPYSIPGYISIPQDLNQGAGGPYIWPYYSTSVCPDTTQKTIVKSNK